LTRYVLKSNIYCHVATSVQPLSDLLSKERHMH